MFALRCRESFRRECPCDRAGLSSRGGYRSQIGDSL